MKLLRALVVNDSEEDTMLVAHEFRRAGYDARVHRVDSAATLTAALERGSWDVVLSDYTMPNFTGLMALSLVRKKSLDVPFISVSGTVAEEITVQMIKAGADEYVTKERLDRLVPVVEQQLREAEERRKRRLAEQALRRSELRFQAVWENSLDGMRLMNEAGTILMVNDAYCRLVERTRVQLEGKSISIIYQSHCNDAVLLKHQERFRTRNVPPHFEKEVTLWNGQKVFVELSNSFIEIDGEPTLLLSTFRDISATKRAEQRVQSLEEQRSLATLSEREAEVLASLAKGRLYKEIASELAISIDTVRKHLNSIYSKLHVHSRTDAVVRYLQK